ncbi:hypothetical protein EMCRGX_G032831 [Ephydatia muelleri]
MSEDSSVSVDSAYTKVVRYGASRPRNSPRRETGSSGLCVSTHTLSADEAKIGKGDRGKELSLLDDEPFRYGKTGMGLEWQMKLQCHVQRPGESLLGFAGELRRIASKAFSDWSNGQLEELVRNQFIQGFVSPTVQMQLMKGMPRSINDAVPVELARKLELLSRHRGAYAKKDGTTFQPQLSCPSEWGSAVTIIRADIWEKVSKCTVSTLAPATQAVVAANGKGLQLDGRVIHVSRRRGSDLAVQPVGFVAVIMESISIPVNCEFQLVATLMVDGMMCRNSLGTPAQFHGASWFGSGTFGGNQQRWCNPSANVESRLLEKGKQWQWTEQCLQAFTLLKTKLTSAPLLVYPNLEEAFIVDCVASDDGLGTVLSQNHQGAEHVVYYASRTLIKAECKYCATRKEMLALVWAIDQFRPYLYVRPFIVCTDHHALQWLRSFKGQVARWLEHLEEFEFTVQHRPGKKHGNADPLSRHPCHQCGNQPVTTDQRGSNVGGWALQWSKQEVIQFQTDDPDIDGMIERFNRTLLSMLKRATIDAERDWDLKLPCLMMAYRTSTKATPFSFMALEQRLVAAYEHIREHLGIEQRRHKQFYDHKIVHFDCLKPYLTRHLDDEPMPDESGREEHSLDETTEDEVLIQDGSRDEITSENQYEEVLVEREDDTLVRQTEPDMLQGVEHGTESQLVETGDATEEDPKKLVPEVDNNMESEEETPEAPEQEGLR